MVQAHCGVVFIFTAVRKKMKEIIVWLAKIASMTAVKSAVITGVVVAGAAAGTTAIVINSNTDKEPSANNTQVTTTTQDTTNNTNSIDSEQEKSDNNAPSSPSQQNTKPSQSQSNDPNNQNNANNNQNSDQQQTPQPTVQPDPQYLSSCIYQNIPHEGEYCPYEAPPAWSASTTTYTCNKSGSLVPCPSYKSIVRISGGVSLSTYQGVTSVYYATCTFDTADDIKREIRVNISYAEAYDNWGVTDYLIDCLKATPV